MSNSIYELPIPSEVTNSPQGIELARVWAANGKQYAALNVDLWEDEAAWGILLVDLARHVANAYSKKRGIDIDNSLDRILQGFNAEWNYPTE